ncbi:MAG TPA: HAMP domain-containing sensor histidine kinase [Terracidiphilus sp.]|jgi:signal transduction histidine kinase
MIGKKSIALRLIVAVLAVELASSLLVAALSLAYERHIHFRAFDTMLHGRADSVLGAVQDAEDAEDNVMLDRADLHLPGEDIYEVYDEHGRLLGRSPAWPADTNGKGMAASTPAQLASTPDNSISRLKLDGGHYRLLLRHGTRIVDPGDRGGGKLHQITVLYGAPTERVWRDIRSAVGFYAAGSILLLAITGPLIAWLLHRGLEPLRQLAALAAGVSVNSWQFSPSESARTTPELAPLTHALASVLERLERAFVQQRTFVSDAAHELKTAVAVVKSGLQLLSLRQRTAAEYELGLARCVADTERLEELVGKMLTLARVESGPSNDASAPGASVPDASTLGPACNIAHCLRGSIAELQPVAALRRVTVNLVNQAARGPFVPLSAGDCSLLVSNLLLNALQHSPPESSVQLRVSLMLDPAGLLVLFLVEDQGEGIDPAALPHVFERFYRGDPSRARSTGGAGLGLAISKAIVERAGGSIELTSIAGKGATVTIRLPSVDETQANFAASSG